MNPIAMIGAALGAVLLLVIVLLGGAVTTTSPIPPAGGCVVVPPGSGDGHPIPGQEVVELDAGQMGIARTIAGVGKGMGIDERGVAIALGTAWQESTFDPNATSPGGWSLGLFQQQGELYSKVDRADPADATRAFFEMLKQRVPDYSNPAVAFADAAQTVQASGAGAGWYARWEQWSTALAAQLYRGATGGLDAVQCLPTGGSGPVDIGLDGTVVTVADKGLKLAFPNEQAAGAAVAALSYLGTPYAWGGGNANGPTRGIRDGGVADSHGDYAKTGFDCAGLTQYAYAQVGVNLTRPARSQLSNAAVTAPWSQALPGDLLFWGGHHVALYLGTDPMGQHLMVEAPESGDVVKISKVDTGGDFRSTVARPAP